MLLSPLINGSANRRTSSYSTLLLAASQFAGKYGLMLFLAMFFLLATTFYHQDGFQQQASRHLRYDKQQNGQYQPLSNLVPSSRSHGADPISANLTSQLHNMKTNIVKLQHQVDILTRNARSEALDPAFHYRAKFLLGRTVDEEDRGHVEPFYLGRFTDTSQARRKVYIDLGMRQWDSSICYMLRKYPVHFDEMYGFECW